MCHDVYVVCDTRHYMCHDVCAVSVDLRAVTRVYMSCDMCLYVCDMYRYIYTCQYVCHDYVCHDACAVYDTCHICIFTYTHDVCDTCPLFELVHCACLYVCVSMCACQDVCAVYDTCHIFIFTYTRDIYNTSHLFELVNRLIL